MADVPNFDDRSLQGGLEKLKAWTASKSRALEKHGSGTPPIERDLTTVETWADDADDSGKAWSQQKRAENEEKVRDAQQWNKQVQQDDQKAKQEADFLANADMKQAKLDLKKQIEDSLNIFKQLGEQGKPGFKGKYAQLKKDQNDANQFIDNDLEKAMETTAKKNAAQRAGRKAIADKMNERAKEAREWNAKYADNPDAQGGGQRADVEGALERIAKWAGEKMSEVGAFGSKGAPLIEELKKDQAWSSDLKGKVGATGPALKAAKAAGKGGVAHARETISAVEGFQAGVEGDANDQMDLYRAWTERNNQTAKIWANSSNAKLREWAKAWQETQE